jgi:threonine aldolase
VLFTVADIGDFVRRIRERDLLINPIAADRLRAVTHLDVTTADIDSALEIVRGVLA